MFRCAQEGREGPLHPRGEGKIREKVNQAYTVWMRRHKMMSHPTNTIPRANPNRLAIMPASKPVVEDIKAMGRIAQSPVHPISQNNHDKSLADQKA
jgi:hypothetical protein